MEKTARFINREMSWLEFNQRVLDEAADSSIPLFERLNFLAISANNLNEFFMVRVGSLELLYRQKISIRDDSDLTPSEQLEKIEARCRRMVREQYRIHSELELALQAQGVCRLRPADLSPSQMAYIERVFTSSLYPLITPLADSSMGKLPFIHNLRLHLAVHVQNKLGEKRLVALPFGPAAERFISVAGKEKYSYILLDEVLHHFIGRFFPNEIVLDTAVFRVTRNADIIAREDFSDDFLSEMEKVIQERVQADCVRMELSPCSEELTALLMHDLSIVKRHVYGCEGPVDLSAYFYIANLTGFETMKYRNWSPCTAPEFSGQDSIFEAIS
ncbi:MAG: RNA degradosome polyphosphate kinase, partial [Planctomycetes bacterium]|nr:RNA degradosome polyphosphate kinase [Planctomycetota bacterium]